MIKMKVIYSRWLPLRGYKCFTLLWWIVVRKGATFTYREYNHECIHFKQEVELGFILFYVLYVFEFLILLLQYRNWKQAYRNISFEREAYDNQLNGAYTDIRKPYTWVKYIRNSHYEI